MNCKCQYYQKQILEKTDAKNLEDLIKKYNNRNDILGCYRKVTKGSMCGEKGKNIKNFKKAIEKNERIKEALEQVQEYIDELPENSEFTAQEIVREKKIHSLADLQRKILDFFICEGKIKKIKFSRGKSGHKYIKAKQDKCPKYFNEICNCKTWLVLAKREEM